MRNACAQQNVLPASALWAAYAALWSALALIIAKIIIPA